MTPFDTGAYASRQSFVTGTAVKECAQLLKQKILDYARTLIPGSVDKVGAGGWLYSGRWEAQIISLEESCNGELLQPEKFLCSYSRGFQTGEEKYSCQRMLLRRGGSGYEAW